MSSTTLLSRENRLQLRWIAIASSVVLLAGLLLAPDRVWSNLLVGTFYLLTIGLGGTLFVALTFVTAAGWHVAFRRVPEAMAMIVPFAGASLLLVLAVRMQRYGWEHHGQGDAGTFWFKQIWLTPWFWLARSVAYVAIWSVLGRWLVLGSRRQDDNAPDRERQGMSVRRSAIFLITYAVTFSLASADWLMALDPMWFSTMWGVYHFAGMIQAVLAAIVILCLLLSRRGRPLHGVFTSEHLHDLGKLLVGFSCFWMYIWFSQYMLIWYANLPEETSYFVARTHGPWGPVVAVSIFLNWLVPFFVLLPKPAKRSGAIMLKVAVVILAGRWVDLYVVVFPATVGDTPVFGIWEVAGIAGVTVAGLMLLDRSFRAANPVPKNDLYLTESLHYHA